MFFWADVIVWVGGVLDEPGVSGAIGISFNIKLYDLVAKISQLNPAAFMFHFHKASRADLFVSV